jgi:hypothetical protein
MNTPGTYPGIANMGGYVGGGALSVHGATNVPASYIVTMPTVPALGFANNALISIAYDTATQIRFDNMMFQFGTSSFGNIALFVRAKATVFVASNFSDGLGQSITVDFDTNAPTNPNGFFSNSDGHVSVGGANHIIVPKAGRQINSFYAALGESQDGTGGSLLIGGANWTLDANLNVGAYWINCEYCTFIPNDVINAAGGFSVIGNKFQVQGGGIINSSGASRNSIPGSIAGIIGTGGAFY